MRDMARQAGVYKITCLPTGKIYVGSACRSFRARFASHRSALRTEKGSCPKLLNAWRKYGADQFRFEPIIVCRPEDALMYEQIALDTLKPQLNVSPTAGNCFGVRHGQKVRDHARERANRQWASGQHSKDALRKRSFLKAKRYFVRGEYLSVLEMSEKYGINKAMITERMKRGISGDALISPRHSEFRTIEIGGEMYMPREIEEIFGIKQETVRYRMKLGLHGEELLARPKTGPYARSAP